MFWSILHPLLATETQLLANLTDIPSKLENALSVSLYAIVQFTTL